MACCGRPSNNAKKADAQTYYERYAFLSTQQKEEQLKVAGAYCTGCQALTMGDPCTVCGAPKEKENKGGTLPSL